MTAREWRISMAAVGLLSIVLAVAGCVAVTINVTFPQEKLDSAAAGIEDMVRSPKDGTKEPRESPASAPAGKKGASSVLDWISWLGPSPAEAQVPELKTRTPEVMAAIESRRARFAQLSSAMASGCVGENNQGLVELRPGSDCPAGLAALVAAENADRLFIYRTLVQQNNMPASDLTRVQAAFAKANRERAPSGSWVQDDAGHWSRK